MIAKSVRTVPYKYNFPLPSSEIEDALRGTIYDPYIRQIMWEGVLGSWRNESIEWASCSGTTSLQTTGGIPQVPIETYEKGAKGSQTFVCPYEWSRPIHQLNCDIVWPTSLDRLDLDYVMSKDQYMELDTPEYAGVIKSRLIVEKLLAMAGVRLASALNGLYADRT